jgi:hypothetical protein
MQLIFQNPLWFFAALVGVPILAHLFSRSRPRRREFPSLRLLHEAMRQVTRVRRPRDRWLLILRTLAMLALAAAFLQPWLLSRFASRSGAARTVVIVIDRTASMAYADGTRTRFAQATSAAEEILDSLSANARANVVWIRAHSSSELPEPGPNLDFLRQALRQATVVPEAGDVGGALSLATRQLADAPGDRELVIISDFQKTSWNDAGLTAQPGLRITRITTGNADAGNLSVAGLAVEPARPVVGSEARVTCRVRNFSGEPHRVTVFAEVGESRLSTAVEVAPWGETLAFMPVTFPQEGLVPMKATISEDRFTGDDVCYALAEVRRSLKVGIVGGNDDATARTWLRAARALDGVAAESLTWAELEGGHATDVLLVSSWNGDHEPALIDHLKHGSLVLHPAPDANLGPTGAKLGLRGEDPAKAEARELPGWGLRIANEDHPVFTLFAGGAYGDPFEARFRHRVALALGDNAKPLLAFDDGRTGLALVDYEIGGQRPAAIAWWNLDLGATTWPDRSAFVLFFGEFVQYMGKRAFANAPFTTDPGERLRFDAGAAFTIADVTLLDERDQARKIAAESTRTPNRLISTEPAEPGTYRWVAQGGVLDRAVVSFPERESDLRLLGAGELRQAGGDLISDDARSSLSDLRSGKPIWAWCIGAAALFFLLEAFCLRSFSKSREAMPIVSAAGAAPRKRELAEVQS